MPRPGAHFKRTGAATAAPSGRGPLSATPKTGRKRWDASAGRDSRPTGYAMPPAGLEVAAALGASRRTEAPAAVGAEVHRPIRGKGAAAEGTARARVHPWRERRPG